MKRYKKKYKYPDKPSSKGEKIDIYQLFTSSAFYALRLNKGLYDIRDKDDYLSCCEEPSYIYKSSYYRATNHRFLEKRTFEKLEVWRAVGICIF